MKNVLFDPHTSGGLLIFCQPQEAHNLLKRLQSLQVAATEIGSATHEREHMLTLT